MPLTLDDESGLNVVPLWIHGKASTASKPLLFPVHSAAQKKDVYMAQGADSQVASAAAESASAAFDKWKQTPAAVRRNIILRAAGIIEKRQNELLSIQIEETSCSRTWAEFNITYTLNALPEIASRITTACTGELPPMAADGTLGLVLKVPIGPVLLIAPWNASVALACKSIASILAAGCSVVFKASELCPRTHHWLLEAYTEAGVPPGVLNVIQVRREDSAAVTETLIAHKAIKKVEFIGSAAVGRKIASLCGRYLKPVLMELGGKCSSIILEDANLEDAAAKCITSAFTHHGQVCFSTERIVIMESVAERFIGLLKQQASGFISSSGVNTRVVRNAYEMLVDAKKKGAEFVFGEPTYLTETSLSPVLVKGTTKDMYIWDEETFGPSASIFVVENDSELISLVNDSAYGLDAFLHTRNMARAIDIAVRLEVGRVRVNNPAHEPTFPFNATKGSGWGANNARAGIEEFLVKKGITLDMRQCL